MVLPVNEPPSLKLLPVRLTPLLAVKPDKTLAIVRVRTLLEIPRKLTTVFRGKLTTKS